MDSKFDNKLADVYKSLMTEEAPTGAESTLSQAAAVAAGQKKKSLARRAYDALTGDTTDADIADAYDDYQETKKSKLLPALQQLKADLESPAGDKPE